MSVEPEINEDLQTLAQDAENARLYGSPPDAIVLRAIELGVGTRAEIKRATGFGYDVIEKCLERNSGELSSQMTGEIERFKLRGAGDALRPESTPSPWRNRKLETTNNGHLSPKCADCGEPRSVGSAERCRPCYEAKAKEKQVGYVEFGGEASPKPVRTSSKFGISVTAEVRKIVEAMNVGFETDTPRLFTALLEAHPALKSHNDHVTLRTYIAQAVLPLKGQLLRVIYKGKAGQPDILCRIGQPDPPLSENSQDAVKIETKVRTEIAQPKPVEVVEPDKKQDKIIPQNIPSERSIARSSSSFEGANQAMALEPQGKYRVKYEGLTIYCDTADEAIELADHFQGRMTNTPKVMPKTVKRAWSKDFENDNSEDGTTGLSMLYLVSMLHDGMEDHEKQAVWTLIQYLKRIQAALEEQPST